MYIGSLKHSSSGINIAYRYKKRGMEVAYTPDYIKEDKQSEQYGTDGRLFSDFIGFDGTVLLNRGVDIEISFDKEVFADTIEFCQGEEAEIAKIEVISDGRVVGTHLAETGKLITEKNLSVGMGVYTKKLTLRLTGAYKHIIIGKLDILGAVDLADAIYPLPKSITYGDGYLEDTSKVTYKIVHSDTESYNILVTNEKALVTASDKMMLNYAKARLNQLKCKNGIRCVEICDSPFMGIRGIHIALPDRDKIEFFKSLVKNLIVPMGYNTVFLQVSGAMEYKNYPEINSAWLRAIENYENGKWPKPAHWEFMSHDILSQDEVRDICSYIRSFGLEIIPEVQTFGHTQYITMAYPELGEIADRADEDVNLFNEDIKPQSFYIHCMCPNHKDYYKVTFGVMDEVIEVINPEKYLHIGHDEIYSIGKCKKCSQIPQHEIYAKEVNALNEHIKSKGLTTMIWSDMIQEDKYATTKAIDMISKDIVCLSFTWYFHLDEDTENLLSDHGFKLLIGNFYSSHYPRFCQRRQNPNLLGAEVSTWVWNNELSLGFDGKLYDFIYSANMMWNLDYDQRLRRTYGEVINRIYPNIAKEIGTGYIDDGALELEFKKDSDAVPYDIGHLYGVAISIAYGEEKEIKADLYAEKIAFLHSTDVCGERIVWKTPKLQGRYSLIYEDGEKYDIDILYGANINEYKRLYAKPVESDIFRHEGYVATCLAKPYMGKTKQGEDFCLYEYTAKNPHPEKKISKIIISHLGDTDAKVILYKIRYE